MCRVRHVNLGPHSPKSDLSGAYGCTDSDDDCRTDPRRPGRTPHGLMSGDMLLKLGGEPVSGVDDLHRLPIADLAGTEQSVEILRAGRLVTRTVKPELDA